MAKKKQSRAWIGGLSRPWEFARRHRSLVVIALLLLGFTLVPWALWQRFKPVILSGPAYQVSAESIVINPPPPWVHSDIVGEAVLNGSLAGMNITEERLTVKVADAFALEPWVERVVRVEKSYPARIEVELVYRRPVAMVEVMIHDKPGLYPVDPHGILLPTDNFDPETALTYPRINVGLSTPAGPVGTPWGDGKVAAAARLVDAIGDDWKTLDLYRVMLDTTSQTPSVRLPGVYAIEVENGSRILWGHAPGEETPGEPDAAMKLTRLMRYAQSVGRLADSPPQQIDLRDGSGLEATPYTAAVPSPPPE